MGDDVTRGGGNDGRLPVHFNVDDELYVGGMPSSARQPIYIRSRTGFVGCMAGVHLGDDDRPLFDQGAELPGQFRDQVVTGCEGYKLPDTCLI